jgi:hypothetical protein
MKEALAECTPAIWYGVTPVVKDGSGVGIFIQTDKGHINRFRLTIESAAALVDALNDSLMTYRRTKSHSGSSLGRPTVDVSSPLDGRNV